MGHKYSILCSKAFRIIEIIPFSEWNISIASVSLDSNIPCIACIAASHPASWPAHNSKHPAAFLMSQPSVLLFQQFVAEPCLLRLVLILDFCQGGWVCKPITLRVVFHLCLCQQGTFQCIFLITLVNALLQSALVVP